MRPSAVGGNSLSVVVAVIAAQFDVGALPRTSLSNLRTLPQWTPSALLIGNCIDTKAVAVPEGLLYGVSVGERMLGRLAIGRTAKHTETEELPRVDAGTRLSTQPHDFL